MAMVPVYNEVNRIQQGNPVPIGGSEPARAFYETQEALGKAIFDLGNALDRGKEDHERFRIQGRIAADKLAAARLVEDQRQRVSGNMNDPSGETHYRNIDVATDGFKQDLVSQLDPRALIYFEESDAQNKLQQTPHFLKTGVDANQEMIKKGYDEMFAGIATKAKLNPEALPAYLMEAQLAVEESTQIPNSKKDGEARAQQANIVASVADQAKQSGVVNQQFKQLEYAKSLLQQHSNLFNSDTLTKELTDIDNKYYEVTSRSRTDITFNQGQLEYAEKKAQAVAYQSIAQKYRSASTPYDLLMVEKEATQLVTTGKITNDQYLNAKGVRKQMYEVVDDLFESRIINQLIQENGALVIAGKKSAVQQINEAYDKKGGISPDRHAKLLLMADKLRENPMGKERYTQMKAYSEIMDAYVKDTITAVGDETIKQERAARGAAFKAKFIDAVIKQPNVEVKSLYEQVVVDLDPSFSANRIIKNTVPSLTNVQQLTDESVKGQLPALKKAVIDAAKSGDPQKMRDANNALFKAQERLKGK